MDRISQVAGFLNRHLAGMSARRGEGRADMYLEETLHSYGVAYLCAAIAYRRDLDPEVAYIMGLLHDIARVLKDDATPGHGPAGALEAERFME